MQLRKEVLLGIYILVSLLIVTAFGAIGLLGRMSPAVEQILQENVYSNQAAEEMLAWIALTDGTPADAWKQRFEENLERLRRNITEAAETPVIERIERAWPAAVQGERPQREEAVRELLRLISINREAMVAADEEAKRLGTAGAWAAVFLSLTGFVISALVVSGFRRRILAPLEDLSATLDATRHGDLRRRCGNWNAPVEVRNALNQVNKLLDERMQLQAPPESPGDRGRIVALHMLDQEPAPSFIVGPEAEIVLANQPALDALSRDRENLLRSRLQNAVESRDGGNWSRVERIGNHHLWWIRGSGNRPEPESPDGSPAGGKS